MTNENEIKESKGSLGGKRYSHPAMAMVSFHRISSSPGEVLFGSSIRHSSLISMTVKKACVDRDLSTDWHFAQDTLLEVYLSKTQFAELLTSMNVGDGVPSTLVSFNGEHFELPNLPSKAEQFKSEIKKDLDDVLADLKKSYALVKQSIDENKPMTKKGLREMEGLLKSFEDLASSHLPFVMDQFSKHMSKVVQEAKASVDAFVEKTYIDSGIEALKKNVPQIEED